MYENFVDVLSNNPLLLATLLFITFGKHLLAVIIVTAIKVASLKETRSVYNVAIGKNQYRREITASWVLFLDGIVFALLLSTGSFHFTKEFSWDSLLLSYICIFLFFEFWFYITHIAMHTRWLFPIHKAHHRSRVINPLSGLQFSLGEKAILTFGSVGFIAALSQFFDVSLHAVLMFFFIYYANSLIGHSNIEIQPSHHTASFLGKVFTSPTYHALHHSRMNGHYGLTITLFDHCGRSVFSDYEKIHARAAEGMGLKRLSERLND